MTNDISDIGGPEEKNSSFPSKTKMTKTKGPDRWLEPGQNSFPKARQLRKFRSYKIFSKKLHISPPHFNFKFHAFLKITLILLF